MSRAKPSFWLFLFIRNSFSTKLPLIVGCAFCYAAFMGAFELALFQKQGAPTSDFGGKMILICLGVGIFFILFALFPQWQKFTKLALVFRNGSEALGSIVEIHFYRGSGYITYEYQYQQEKLRSTDSVNQNRKTKRFAIGQQVLLYIDRENPSQAFVRDLYLNTF